MVIDQVLAHFDVTRGTGLGQAEAKRRIAHYGPNQLRKTERQTIWQAILEEAREPLILLLLATGGLYLLFGEPEDSLTIFFVIFTLMGIEIFNERRAERAIAALGRLSEPTALVRREGRNEELDATQIVPGDVLLLQAGRAVPADARLIESFGLTVDESSLTGESVPVEKDAQVILPEDTIPADRRNLVFAGTTTGRGRGSAVVVSTGMATELGHVARLTEEVKPPPTPLQTTMRELTRWMVWIALGLSVLIPLLGWWLAGQPLQQMILTGLSLAFATIPEEGPIIITMVLALGGYRLSKRKAIVKELSSVEALGAVTVIATDKTGTLTENRVAVHHIHPDAHRPQVLEVGALCNEAYQDGDEFKGDPLEVALLQKALRDGIDLETLRRARPLRTEFSFDNVRKRMSVVCESEGGLWVGVKGAPESVLSVSTRALSSEGVRSMDERSRRAILEETAKMAAEGLRVIAFGEKRLPPDSVTQEEAEADLTYIGMAGLADPPRPEARDAVAACRGAGIRVLMVTGDHPLAASAIAAKVGLDRDSRVVTGAEIDRLTEDEVARTLREVSVFARTAPEHKLRIVQTLQRGGERVAATGDGTNDAPALVAADIGVAMGETGSDVARGVADIVLADDNFATIVRAIEEGRVLFANLKKGLVYYLTCKVALVSATLLPVLLRLPVPFTPVQIILTELFMDLAASSTFVAERGEPYLMRRPPRDPKAPFMDRSTVARIIASAAGLFAAVSLSYLVSLLSGAGLPTARTVAFVTWLLGHVFLALNMRSEREPILRLGLFSNRLMIAWAAATVGFVLLVTAVPVVQSALKTQPLSVIHWMLSLATAFLGTFWMEAWKALGRRDNPESQGAS